MKRLRHPSSSDDSDNGSNSTCWSQHSSQHRRGTGQKPSEVFRTDLITAMKVHDSYQLNPEDYYVLADPWRQEWEKGVQVPVSPQSIPQPVSRVLAEKGKEVMFIRPKKLIRTSRTEALGYVDIRTLAEGTCRYDLNEEDVAWLQIINEEFAEMAMPPLDELTMERVMEEFEHRCHDNMTHTVETEEGLGIEYDEDVVCDVCLSPDGEDNNEMVFCDKCNICVHQACYGIQKVPKGSWLCRICALGILPKCQLCPKKGGAMKPTRSGTKWVHVSCALWIPEVSIGNPEKMEPITNVSHIPSNRWALICCLCKEKTGACIQCSAKNCRTAFHVTCGLQASLEMSTVLTEDDEVKFKSFCPKHSGIEGTEPRAKDPGTGKESLRDKKRWTTGGQEELSNQQQEKRVSLRKMKLQEMEEEFYQFVAVEEVAKHLKLSLEVVDFLYQYWKLKRKASFNRPLLVPKKDEEESLARREQEVLLRRLQLFTHLRQDLERVRNLTYMVTRREKMKRSLCKIHEQIFQHQIRLLDHELLNGDPSEEDLEELFSLGWLSSQESGSQLSLSGLRTKRGSVKRRKSPPDSNRKPPEMKDREGSRVQKSHMRLQIFLPKLQKPEAAPQAPNIKLHKPESEKVPGRENGELARRKDEQEERGRKRRGDGTEQVNKFGSKHLEKTVSIRLVDIRNSESDERFVDDGTSRRSAVAFNTKLNKTSLVSVSRTNGWLGKSPDPDPDAPSRPVAGHLKSWGKFRIPKRSNKPQAEAERRKPLLRPLTNTPEPSYLRTRLRDESDAAGGGELEPCLKQCHSHKLRGGPPLGRQYGSEVIRRGVLAS